MPIHQSLPSFVIFKTFASFLENQTQVRKLSLEEVTFCEVVLRNVIHLRERNVACCAINCRAAESAGMKAGRPRACPLTTPRCCRNHLERSGAFADEVSKLLFWKTYSLPQKKKGIELVCIRFMKIVRSVCSLVSTTSSHY